MNFRSPIADTSGGCDLENGKMKTILVGAGPMSRAYARVLQQWGRRFHCFGRGQASAETFEAATGVRPTTGPLEDQLAATNIAGAHVIVAVNLTELASVCRHLLKHGAAAILVEKPGALDLDAMKKLAQVDNERRIRVAYNRRFLPSVQKANAIIAQDGGVKSMHFEFTELPDRIEALGIHPVEVLANWPFANSSHVFDLAFFMAGAAPDLSDVTIAAALQQGALSWHPQGTRFAAVGSISDQALFSCSADWRSGGGWAVEVTTTARRLRLRPLETLTEQKRETFVPRAIELPRDDAELKPGVSGMLTDFFDKGGRSLPDMRQQVARMSLFAKIVGHTRDSAPDIR